MIEVVIPTWQPDRAAAVAQTMRDLQTTDAVRYLFVTPTQTGVDWSQKFDGPAFRVLGTAGYLSPVEAMAKAGAFLLAEQKPADIFVWLHDDAEILEGAWDQEIVDLFDYNKGCGLAGLGGSPGLGTDDLYKAWYDHRQLARVGGFWSNMREAEQHGARTTEVRQVSVLDGFCLITSRGFYSAACDEGRYRNVTSGLWGAWDHCLADGIPYHMYDAWLCCRAAELEYETWLLPLACHHEGGQTSVLMKDKYEEVVQRLGYLDAQDLYDKAHRIVYERFRGILPLRVKGGR